MWGWSGGGLGPVLPHVFLWTATNGIDGVTSVFWSYSAGISGPLSPEFDLAGEQGGRSRSPLLDYVLLVWWQVRVGTALCFPLDCHKWYLRFDERLLGMQRGALGSFELRNRSAR